MKPLISILLPTRNGQRYIRDAIQSVFQQKMTEWELIIIDDASTDRTSHIVHTINDSRVVILRNQQQIGLTRSLNRAIERARGTYIARIDDDDVWTNTRKLSDQLQFLEENPSIGLVGTAARVINEQGNVLYTLRYPTSDEELRACMLYRNQFNHSSIMLRAAALAAAGGKYDNAKIRSQDYDLWLRIGMHAKLANLPDAMVNIRQRKNAVSGQYHRDQFWSFIQSAYKYRHVYPSFYRYTPIYVREAILNILPHGALERIKLFRQVWL